MNNTNTVFLTAMMSRNVNKWYKEKMVLFNQKGRYK